MEDCVDEKTFYEKLESLKRGESKVTVYIDDSFYESAKNYLQTLPKFQQVKEHESHAKLEELFWLFGFPQTLHTDNGKEFKNKLMHEFCQNHGIKQAHGAPRKPQTQGLVERNNRTIKENLTNILKENQADVTTWCSRLGEAAYKKNITIHRAVKEIPYRLVFGIDPKKEKKLNPTQEEDQLSEMANTNAPVKRKTPPTTECESRKRTRIEVNSRQIEYNEKMKKSRQKPQTLNIGDFVSIKIDLVDKTPLISSKCAYGRNHCI